MALNMPTFYKRTGSAIVFAAIMLAGLFWNEWSFFALICIINFLCLREFFQLLQKINKEIFFPWWVPLAIQAPAFLLIVVFGVHTEGNIAAIFWLIFRVLGLLPATLLLISALSKKHSLTDLLQAAGGLFYITLPMILLLNMRLYDFALPIALIFMIWSNDTLAYLVGSFIGKTPFSPISPKKTWEGTAGGAILTIIGAVVYGHLSQTYRMIDWIMLSLLTTTAGTLGDLLESKLKRLADVKDSGALMPGHGGALDRFDSLLIATPFVYVYVSCFMR